MRLKHNGGPLIIFYESPWFHEASAYTSGVFWDITSLSGNCNYYWAASLASGGLVFPA